MDQEQVFVYARLHNPEVQVKITGKVWDTPTGDSIPGYKKTTMVYNDLSYPVVEENAAQTADGFVYEMTMEDLKKVDHFLGEPYKRIRGKTTYGTDVWFWVKNPEAFPQEKPYEKPTWLQ